eukprot:GHVP01012382.1.p1 GENE.GHVP01012382.1~~GHVP01012382.1.p1  ORF type:complete len:140 (+),score=15.76 GHVP01012382.1:1-420(+)
MCGLSWKLPCPVTEFSFEEPEAPSNMCIDVDNWPVEDGIGSLRDPSLVTLEFGSEGLKEYKCGTKFIIATEQRTISAVAYMANSTMPTYIGLSRQACALLCPLPDDEGMCRLSHELPCQVTEFIKFNFLHRMSFLTSIP